MEYRLDKYGNKISVLGYGCMRFTQKAGKIDIKKAEQEIMTAYDSGVNYYDTAYIYPGSKAMRHAGNLFNLLNMVACNKYKKWEITRIFPWHDDEIIPAIKWLVEEKLNYTPKEACHLTRKDFADHNLDGMLQRVGRRSVLAALDLAYPGVYCRDGRQGIKLKE